MRKKAHGIEVKFVPAKAPKVADVELWFHVGPLAGLKLMGFAIWHMKGAELTVTRPSRSYSVDGERRTFSLLRAQADEASVDQFTTYILAAWERQQGTSQTGEQP